jgi:hypothetical protein
MKSIVLFSPATSATMSIQRIIGILVNRDGNYVSLRDVPAFDEKYREGHILLVNRPTHFDSSTNYGNYKLVVNLRDPRDRACNVYHWKLVHPTTEEDSVRNARIERTKEMGVDAWVLNHYRGLGLGNDHYNAFFEVIEKAPADCRIAISYAQLCLSFDTLIAKLSEFFHVSLSNKQKEDLEKERVEKIESNSNWIGQKWAGSDTLPGRYKRELSEQTISEVSAYYEQTLRRMAKYDPDFAYTYLEGFS